MRVRFLHCDLLEYEVTEKALRSAEDLPPERRKGRIEDALVCFISAEKEDEADPEGIVREAVRNIEEVASQVKATRVAIYPYAHLSSSLASSGPAQKIFALLEERLRKGGFHVLASPFGYYKSFKVSVKGHPLSELSREIHATGAAAAKDEASEAVKAEQKLVSEWFILEPGGALHPLRLDEGKVAGFDFAGHENLRKFASYEMAKSREAKEEPPHVRLMRELELVDYEPGSDSGNLRFYAKGRLMKGLLEEFVTRRVVEYGGMEVESPVMYDFEHPALQSYLNRFPARQYIVQTPNKKAFLRFSACFGQFLIAHDMVISYKQLPVALYELTRYSFRAEQRGELSGLRRLRAFTMPDCHALCADLPQAREQLMVRFELAWTLLQDIGFRMPEDFEVGMRVTKDFYDANKDFVNAYAKRWGRPVLMERWSHQFFYYVFKYEWNFVDANLKAAALTTDQIDTENAKRFGITYTDAAGKEQFPYILHLSPSGAIERVMYGLLEKAAFDREAGRVPMFPLWLAPVQVRLIPVSEDQLPYCEELLSKFAGVRADLDDMGDTLNKSIRRAEKEWVPFIAVVGKKEVESNSLTVRVRGTKEQQTMSPAQLRESVIAATAGRPFRPLPLPDHLSRRPTFRG
jgi:threonyl-tRNA synthetase